MEYIHTWVRKSVSGSFAGQLRRALDGNTANAGPEHDTDGKVSYKPCNKSLSVGMAAFGLTCWKIVLSPIRFRFGELVISLECMLTPASFSSTSWLSVTVSCCCVIKIHIWMLLFLEYDRHV